MADRVGKIATESLGPMKGRWRAILPTYARRFVGSPDASRSVLLCLNEVAFDCLFTQGLTGFEAMQSVYEDKTVTVAAH